MAQAAKKAKKAKKAKPAAAAAAAAEPSAAAINRARPIVLEALGFPGATDSTKLARLGFDGPSMAGLAADLRDAGAPKLRVGTIAFCTDVLCVIKAVARING